MRKIIKRNVYNSAAHLNSFLQSDFVSHRWHKTDSCEIPVVRYGRESLRKTKWDYWWKKKNLLNSSQPICNNVTEQFWYYEMKACWFHIKNLQSLNRRFIMTTTGKVKYTTDGTLTANTTKSKKLKNEQTSGLIYFYAVRLSALWHDRLSPKSIFYEHLLVMYLHSVESNMVFFFCWADPHCCESQMWLTKKKKN